MRAFIRLVGLVAASCSVVFLSACAGVSFYKEADLENRTGIPIYGAEPYLLVARTGAKDKPVEASIVYITNNKQVVYAKPRSGFGSSNLTLTLTGGQLTSFGQQTDTKIPELITSLAGLITARAGAEKTGAEADAITRGLTTQQSGELIAEAAKKVRSIAEDMAGRLAAGELNGLHPEELGKVRSSAQALLASAISLEDPSLAPNAQQAFDTVKAQAELLETLPAPTPMINSPRDQGLQHVHAWASALKDIFEKTVPAKPEKPTFELYKIEQTNSGPRLVPVTAQ